MSVIIADSIHIDMVQWASAMTTHITMMVVQKKTWLYVEQTLKNDFILLAIETYGCFHFCFNSFFYHICTYHYCMSLVIFFSPLDACFLLLIVCVHNLTTHASHNDSSMSYCIWLGFHISSTHHSFCTSITSRFVANDNSFILNLFCYRWLSFRKHESSLHRVFT
jgi:hypothetical protein